MYKDIKYFKGLNALRFFAAYMVLVDHAEQIRWKNQLFNLKELSFFNKGGTAVTFFFVLSGFLITYLLIKERKQSGSISIKKFYTRRILRIWPLYFLLVIIGTLIIPYFLSIINHPYEMPYEFNDVILYYVLFSPFMVNVLYGHHFLEPLWSIGVEELFYIIWAPLFKFVKKHILTIIISIIALKFVIVLIASNMQLHPQVLRVLNMLQFESMAIGGLAAYIVYHRKTAIESSIAFSRASQVILISYLLFYFLGKELFVGDWGLFEYLYETEIISRILLTCTFAWLIVNVSLNKKSLINLENSILNFLGNISYGIYMYHMLIIFTIILLFKNQLETLESIPATIIFYLAITAFVVLLSFLSKKFFEDYFLSLKNKCRVNEQPSSGGIIAVKKG